MSELIDLHIHSIYSDGDNTPDEIIKKAIESNVKTISITDHDTVLAYQNLKPQNFVEIIPGIELSAQDDIRKMHILGYGIDPHHEKLINATKKLRQNNIESLLLINDYLKKVGVYINDDNILSLTNREGNVGRVLLAKLLVEYGYSRTIKEAFNNYLVEAKEKTKSMIKKPSYKECLELIIRSGGIPILAHPYTLKLSDNELEKLVKEMMCYGLMGLEVYHSNQDAAKTKNYFKLIHKYDLLYSGGSDYHGSITKPEIEIGYGREKRLRLTRCSVLDYTRSKN